MEPNESGSLIEAIRRRVSIRNYQDKKIPDSVITDLDSFITKIKKGPFGSEIKFQILSPDQIDQDHIHRNMTYGFIQGSPYFIVGTCLKGQQDIKDFILEDFGYLFESIILFATQFNLATCWLAGSFSKDHFKKIISLSDPNFYIPAVASLGQAKEKKQLSERILKKIVQANSRKPREELFFEKDFTQPLSIDPSSPYFIATEMVRLAPSASNKQPWRIIKEPTKNEFHFILQRNIGLAYKLVQNLAQIADTQRIDMGIALCHFQKSLEELKVTGQWKRKWDSNETFPIQLPENCHYMATWITTH